MSKQKKRINEETANETGKTEGKKERDYAGGREREKVSEERGWIQLLLQV